MAVALSNDFLFEVEHILDRESTRTQCQEEKTSSSVTDFYF